MKTLSFAVCLSALLAGAVQSSTNVYEPVQYLPGPLNLKGIATGFSAPWAAEPGVVVVPAGLSSPLALPSMGGSVSGFFNFVDPLTNNIAPSPGTEFWASFLLYHSGPNDQAFMGLAPAGTSLGSLPSAAFGVRLGQYGIFIGGAFFAAPTAFTPNGSTDLLVTHFVAGVGIWTVSLYVNPAAFGVPDLVLAVPGSSYGTMVNHNQAEFGSDEFRIGDTAGDVAVAGVTPALGATWGRVKAQYR